jgi:hypothetical protein
MKVLIACEESQELCKAFREKGHEAYSCDLQDCSGGRPEWHLKCDIRIPLSAKKKNGSCYWDLIIAHPTCTYLCNSGVGWLYRDCRTGTAADRWIKMIEATKFFMLFYNHSCEKIVIENPIPHKYAALPKFTQSIQPWQFGETEKKRTCLWIKGLPKLKHTEIMPVELRNDNIHRMGWSKNKPELRSKLRSKTFPGIARAMADQWG